MKQRLIPACALVVALATTVCAGQASAGVDVCFGAALQIGDDTEVYLAFSSRYYDREEEDVRRWHRHCGESDDLAVALFVARQSGRNPDDVLILRGQGLAWWEISLRLGVKPEVWFVPVTRNPGPPYGNAYGRWKKHGKGGPDKIALSDAEARDLVAVRMLHEYYGVTAEMAMDWRASGKGLRELSAGEYRRRHGGKHANEKDAAKVAVQADETPGKGKGPQKHGGKGK
jgi:hypothetical protein